jgi:hypothetical protein
VSEPDQAAGKSQRDGTGPDSIGPEPKGPETGQPENTKADAARPTGTARQSVGPPGETGGDKSGALVGQVVGTTSFFAALLFYMGWNYDNSQLSPFLIPTPQSIGLSTTDFAASGIYQLFASNAVLYAAALVAVILMVVSAIRALPDKKRNKLVRMAQASGKLFVAGLLLTVITLTLIWWQVSSGAFPGWLGSHIALVYLALALLAGGLLLMTWPTRREKAGRVAYSLAIVVTGGLALWAGGVYASTLGSEAAAGIEGDVHGQPAVAVYSTEPLDLSGPDVHCTRVQAGPGYPYECTGLRLLYLQAGTYYLLADGWTLSNQRTYILDDSDQIRVELYP